jgi:plasmid stability protein
VSGGIQVLDVRCRVQTGQDPSDLRDMVRIQASGVTRLEEALETPVLETDDHSWSVTRNASPDKPAVRERCSDSFRPPASIARKETRTLTIRKLDEKTKTRLRLRAAAHGTSMEEEARTILRAALAHDEATAQDLVSAIRRRFEPLGGVELELPAREPIREPPGQAL